MLEMNWTDEERKKVARRFWKKVERLGVDDCWPWRGAMRKDGYGVAWAANKGNTASRVAYILSHPEYSPNAKRHICHSCDNPSCCNPAHLWDGTPLENTMDAVVKKRVRTKLSIDAVWDIRIKAVNAEAIRDCARKYGIHPNHVIAVQKRRYWKHLPD